MNRIEAVPFIHHQYLPMKKAKPTLNAVNAPNATTTRTSPSVHFEDTHCSNTSTSEHDESMDTYHSANDLDEGMLARL